MADVKSFVMDEENGSVDSESLTWDGFLFYADEHSGKPTFDIFTVLTEEFGPGTKHTDIPQDRERCTVLLISSRNNIVTVDDPFTSHFIDAFVYAKQMVFFGFRGVIMKTYHEQVEAFIEQCAAQAKLAAGRASATNPLLFKVPFPTKQEVIGDVS